MNILYVFYDYIGIKKSTQMTEYKYIIMSEENIPMNFMIKISENREEPGSLQNIIIECTYEKQHYAIIKNDNKIIVKNILLAFKSNENHNMSFSISRDNIVMLIVSELLAEPLKYVLKCTNNIKEMSRMELEHKIIELEKRIDESQTEEYWIVDEMIDKKIVGDLSLLFDESNHKLFFEDLVDIQKKAEINVEKGQNYCSPGGRIIKLCNSSSRHDYHDSNRISCASNSYTLGSYKSDEKKKLGIEHIYSQYDLIYTNKISENDIYIKGYFKIFHTYKEYNGMRYKNTTYYCSDIHYAYASDIYTIFRKRTKPVYGKISVIGNLLKLELYHEQHIESNCNIKIPVCGNWLLTKSFNTKGEPNLNVYGNVICDRTIVKSSDVFYQEYTKINMN